MIDDLLVLIIRELGPTGLLICGLYLLLGKCLKRICSSLEIINKEIGEIRDALKEIVKGKNGKT